MPEVERTDMTERVEQQRLALGAATVSPWKRHKRGCQHLRYYTVFISREFAYCYDCGERLERAKVSREEPQP